MHYHHPWSPAAAALEKIFGRFAFPSPIRTLVIFQVLVTILSYFSPGYLSWLTLDREKIMAGEVWRLLTFIFVATRSIWLIIFYVFIMWIVNDGLEEAWGEFRLNLYLFFSWLGLVLAAFFLPVDVGGFTSIILYSSIFIAFASIYPNYEFLLFFILPLKVKWLAIVNAALLFTLVLSGLSGTLLVLLGMGPYLVVFLPKFFHYLANRSQNAARRTRFQAGQADPADPFHKCSSCGVTDAEEPELDFRIGDDDEEYCSNCLPGND